MRRYLAFMLTLLLVLTAVGCGAQTDAPAQSGNAANANPKDTSENLTSSETAVGTDSISISNDAPIPDYDPVNWYISSQSSLFQNVYSTLVDVIATDDLEIELRPNLAKSWETEEENTVWVFHLNEDAVYSNGDPVKAEHVKNCFERHMTNPYTMTYVSMIDSIEVRDEHTVAIRLKNAWASVPYCWYMVAIFNPDLYDADKESYIKNPVGSGPYELTALDEAQGTMRLTLKEDWWGTEKPTVKTIDVCTITDPSTRVIALQNGEIDFASLNSTNLRLVEGDNNLEMRENVSIVGYQLLLNPNVEPLNNEKVREAISYAIDYNGIRNATCGGYVSSKDRTVVFSTLDTELPGSITPYTYDPAKAQALLAESGLELPIDVGEIVGGNSNGSAEMVQQYLADVGINATITQYESNATVTKLMNGEFSLGIAAGVGCPTAAETMLNYYGTGQPYNFNKYSNPEVDALIDTLMTTSDAEEYQTCLEQALQIVVGDYTNMGLGIPAIYGVSSKGLYIPPVWNGVDMIRVR
ncbi:MAG: ABC transporter substrate-binding protein [Clostridiales bacterium]|nr:ABC transporter substrate-binding protein [Clostridiales bacterium]